MSGESGRLSTFALLIDWRAGFIRYLKTTLFGLTGCSPDYVMLIVGGNAGLIGMSKVKPDAMFCSLHRADCLVMALGTSGCSTGLTRSSYCALHAKVWRLNPRSDYLSLIFPQICVTKVCCNVPRYSHMICFLIPNSHPD